jgi:hypothetical protein
VHPIVIGFFGALFGGGAVAALTLLFPAPAGDCPIPGCHRPRRMQLPTRALADLANRPGLEYIQVCERHHAQMSEHNPTYDDIEGPQ